MGEENDMEEKQPALAADGDGEKAQFQKDAEDGKVEVKVVSPANPYEGMSARLAFAIFAIAFGSAFQHGYNTGVLNTPQEVIQAWIMDCGDTYADGTPVTTTTTTTPAPGEDKATDVTTAAPDYSHCENSKSEAIFIYSQIVSAFCIGGMLGGTSVSLIAGKLGRKGGLLANNVLVVLASAALGSAKAADTWALLIVGRLIIGVNAGINAGLAPMYLSEIAPVALRGAVGTVYQLIITISILFSQVMGMGSVLGTEDSWPWVLALTVFPGILQLCVLPLVPESPKYLLIEKEDNERANEALVWLRGKVDVHSEMDDMRNEKEELRKAPKATLTEMVRTSSLRAPLIIAMMMMLAQQLTGINAAMFYSTQIFNSAGLEGVVAQYATLAMGTVNVLMTVVSLVLIEKAGRKTLMLIGLIIMTIATTLLMICLLLKESAEFLKYMSVVMVIIFVIGFATGPGSIPWFFVTELFKQSGRPIATSVAVVTNWSANFLVGLAFAPLEDAIKAYVFTIFIAIQILFVLYVKLKVPETKNRTIEDITSKFK